MPVHALALAAPPDPGSVFALLDRAVVRALLGFLLFSAWAVASGYALCLVMMLLRFLAGGTTPSRGAVSAAGVAYLLATAVGFFLVVDVVPELAAEVTSRASARLPLAVMVALAPIHFVAVLAGYAAAATFAPMLTGTPGPPPATSPAELGWRRALIVLNAALNGLGGAAVVLALSPLAGGTGTALAVGFVLCAINLSALVLPTGTPMLNVIVHFVLGWTSWLMPMSWLAAGLGWLLFFLNVLGDVLFASPLLTWSWSPWWQVVRMELHWPTGTIFTEGGVSANARLQGGGGYLTDRNAYDLAGFSWFHSITVAVPSVAAPTGVVLGAGSAMDQATIEHESGHALNVAALGSWFHAVGGFDENVPPAARGSAAYAERLAESHVTPPSPRPIVPLWWT
jgi:hypothetical protein